MFLSTRTRRFRPGVYSPRQSGKTSPKNIRRRGLFHGKKDRRPHMAIWDDIIPPEEQATYRAAGWGGRVGYGESPALVVVDMCNSFVDMSYPFASPAAQKAVPS